MTSETLRTWLAALAPSRVRVALPSFVVVPGEPLALRDLLVSAGMALAFDPHRAGFSEDSSQSSANAVNQGLGQR